MTIICSVAAVFTNRDGDVYQVRPSDRGVIKEAPDWIQDTLMFKWLAKDGSIKYVNSANKIEAENDPMKGLGADGKKAKKEKEQAPVEEAPAEETPAEEAEEEKPRTTTRRRTKKDDAK